KSNLRRRLTGVFTAESPLPPAACLSDCVQSGTSRDAAVQTAVPSAMTSDPAHQTALGPCRWDFTVLDRALSTISLRVILCMTMYVTNKPNLKLELELEDRGRPEGTGERMDGVLEATITLFGCKVLCSLLCLPTFKRSMSSVGLCCSCLLFFTDLSITVFLAYLWCGGPRLASFQPSSDIIALRFGLFLGHTYGAVLLLTPPLVTVEVLTRFLWPREETVEVSVEGQAVEEKDACPGASALLTVVGGEPWEEGVTGVESGRGLKAVGFLGCLLLWGMCGTFAGSSWTQTLPAVRACLEGGSSLSTCLPCLITTSSPITEELAWALPTAALLLGLAPGVGLLTARLACTFVQAEEHVCAEQREDTPVFHPCAQKAP
ncbi:hypothetical protein P4O66_006095, partial [Electrophorus voltai]